MGVAQIHINQDTDISITVDVQPTFMPGGGLPVAGGDEIVPTVLHCESLFYTERRFATLDRHPLGHISLASSYFSLPPMTLLDLDRIASWDRERNGIAGHAKFSFGELRAYLSKVGTQVLWPDHAIEGTKESFLHPSLHGIRYMVAQVKGMDPLCDSYSGITDALGRPTGLGDALMKSTGAMRAFVWGLAFDFCVGRTAIDAAKLGFKTYVVRDATRSVDLPGSVGKMEADLAAAGVRTITSSDLTR